MNANTTPTAPVLVSRTDQHWVRALPRNFHRSAREKFAPHLGPDVEAAHPDGTIHVVADAEAIGVWLSVRRDGLNLFIWIHHRDEEVVQPATMGDFYARHGLSGVTALSSVCEPLRTVIQRPALAEVLATVDAALTA